MLYKSRYHLLLMLLVITLPCLLSANTNKTNASHFKSSSSSQYVKHILNYLIASPKKSMCKEACWAMNASTNDLKKKYGSAEPPARFKFALPYVDQSYQTWLKCMKKAMKNNTSKQPLSEAVKKKCTQQADQKCIKICKSQLKK